MEPCMVAIQAYHLVFSELQIRRALFSFLLNTQEA